MTPEIPIIQNPEGAYTDYLAQYAFLNSDWFTSEYIEEVRANEPFPERESINHPYSDPSLVRYFNESQYVTKETHPIFVGAHLYASQNMVGVQGHPFNLEEISFCDEEILHLAKSLGVKRNHNFDRFMSFSVINGLMSIVAPPDIRRKVVHLEQSWGEGFNKRRIDVLLYSQLVRKGARRFIEQLDSGDELK